MLRKLALFICLMINVSCFASVQNRKLVVLFTSDLHSQVLPDKLGHGGYSAIESIVQLHREQAAGDGSAFFLLDAGDIAMGTVFHSVFAQEGIEYRAMARLGYDAVVHGNHDFDFGTGVYADMRRSAHKKDSLLQFPVLVSTNLKVPGVESCKWKIIEKEGVKVGLMALVGNHSYSVVARDASKLEWLDPVEAAKEAVADMKQSGADYIIALSHSGTVNDEDVELAKKVKGIDLIVSGHDHRTMHEPLKVKDTYIGAPGPKGKYVGKAVFSNGELEEYALLETIGKGDGDSPVSQWVDSMCKAVEERFIEVSGRKLDDTLAFLECSMYDIVDEGGFMPLGSNIAQSYRDAALANIEGVAADQVIGFVPFGVVRGSLEAGAVTNKDVFEVLSLGENSLGYTGYPLVYAWVYGSEVKDMCEMSVSIAPFIEDTRLYMSGVRYRSNDVKLPFTRVEKVFLDGNEIDSQKLYLVVTGLYTARLMGVLEKESYGILSVAAKDSLGNLLPPGQFFDLTDASGRQITEWEAFAGYVEQGKLNASLGYDSIEKDNSIPLGYIVAAVLVCALLLYLLRKKVRLYI